jgi:hypothetical protein
MAMVRELLLVLFACVAGLQFAGAQPGDASWGSDIFFDTLGFFLLNYVV